MYLCFLSFLNAEMVQVIEILPHGRQGSIYPEQSIVVLVKLLQLIWRSD